MGLMSILAMAHIFRHIIMVVDGKTMGPFLETPLISLNESQVPFISTIGITIIGLYLLFSVHKGHNKLGQRFYTF